MNKKPEEAETEGLEAQEGEEANFDSDDGLTDADFSNLDANQMKGSNVLDMFADNASGDIAKLQEEIKALRAENDENKDKYLRSLAEFENFKKRSLKERSELIKYQGEKVLFDVLEVVDNLELALQHADAERDKIISGVEMIYKRLIDTLAKWDVKGESAMGKEFDPAKHSAISKVPSPDAKQGIVINELKKAYFYKDKLLRVGEVVVSDGSPAE